jgi:hypothetical protein
MGTCAYPDTIREADGFAANALHKQQNQSADPSRESIARYPSAACKFPANTGGAGER